MQIFLKPKNTDFSLYLFEHCYLSYNSTKLLEKFNTCFQISKKSPIERSNSASTAKTLIDIMKNSNTVNLEMFAPYTFLCNSHFLKIGKNIYSVKISFTVPLRGDTMEKRRYKSTQNCQFSPKGENVYTHKYLRSQ